MAEKVLDMNGGAFVQQATDPVVSNVATPVDFAAQFPTPLDTTEIIAMCEEITLWKSLPEVRTGLKAYTWRELNELELTSGSTYLSFSDGACPEEYRHDGDNVTITLKNIGVKKSLTISDIMHSAASIQAGYGISALLGANASSAGMPGGGDMGTFVRENIANLKEKEVRLGMTLTMNGWDRLLVEGSTESNALEFDGIENFASAQACTMHVNDTSVTGTYTTGTFSAASFDRFLGEACVKPTAILGHPSAIQEMMSGYFQLGFAGSQVVNFQSGDRIVPGFNFASFVNTGVGRLGVIADNNFNRTTVGSTFLADLWALRMSHNGEPLVFKLTQIPLSLRDLAPGCTAISFEIWAKTALVIKHCCAQGRYRSWYAGRIYSNCPVIG